VIDFQHVLERLRRPLVVLLRQTPAARSSCWDCRRRWPAGRGSRPSRTPPWPRPCHRIRPAPGRATSAPGSLRDSPSPACGAAPASAWSSPSAA
jgi:hypothetical protein